MKTILLVEDDRQLAAHWHRTLEDAGFRVIHEPSVEGAIDVLDDTKLDLVITDIVLESEDEQLGLSGGLAVISYIALNVDPQPKIIAATGHSHSAFVDRNFERMNSMRRLRKPVSPEELLRAVHALLETHDPPPVDSKQEIRSALQSRFLLEVFGATEGVWDWDVRTDDCEFSAAMRVMLGFLGDDVIGFPNQLETLKDRVHPDDQKSLWSGIEAAIAKQVSFEQEFRILNRGGEYCWVRSRGTASVTEDGKPIRVVASTYDIGQQKQAERERLEAQRSIEESEERFRWAMSNSNIGLWEWDIASDHVYFDDTCKIQLGYPTGMWWASFEDGLDLLHPEDTAHAARFRESLLANPQEACEATFRLRTESGDYRWIRTVGRGFRDKSGEFRVVGVHIDIHDVTEAKRTAEESERRFRALADSASPLAWTTELDSNCSWLNKRWLDYCGQPLESQLGFGWIETVHPEDRDQVQASYESAFQRQEPFKFEYRLRRHDGEYRWFMVNATPRFDEHGEFVGYVGMSFDNHDVHRARVTLEASEAQLKNINTQLKKTNADLEQFAYVASHDLKQPLRGIDNLAKWVIDDVGDSLPEASRKHLLKMRDRVTRLDGLLDDLLSYSRAGRVREDIVSVDTGALVRSVVEVLAPPPTFSVDCAPDMPTFETERTPLEQVFRNLIGNAIKHRQSDSGRVTVRHASEGDWVTFEVQDDGPGIEPKFHDRVFQMFSTLKPRDEVEGSGMGLALVRKLIEAQGGRIGLESALGHGTVFRFTWPLQHNTLKNKNG